MNIYMDIETIPTSNPQVIERIAAKVTPPGSMKKAETIAKWEAEDKPAAVEQAVSKTGLNGGYGRVCCIGWAIDPQPGDVDAEVESLSITEDTNDDERSMLQTFFDKVLERQHGPFKWIGHNIARFDLRFLYHRCVVLGIDTYGLLPVNVKPWDEGIADTMVMWAGATEFISLDELCNILGFDGKGDVTGADVAGLFKEGKVDEIAEYCMADVVRTILVHSRLSRVR